MGTNTGGLKWTIRTQRQNGLVDGNLRVEVNGGYKTGTTVIDDGEWHHIAVTWTDDGTPDVNDALLYVDGVLETTDAVLDETMNTANGIDVRLGESVNGRNWDGWLDDMRIYDEVLDADAIFYLRSRGLDGASARALLTCAFANEIIDRIGFEPLRRELEELIVERFQNNSSHTRERKETS